MGMPGGGMLPAGALGAGVAADAGPWHQLHSTDADAGVRVVAHGPLPYAMLAARPDVALEYAPGAVAGPDSPPARYKAIRTRSRDVIGMLKT